MCYGFDFINLMFQKKNIYEDSDFENLQKLQLKKEDMACIFSLTKNIFMINSICRA